MKRLAIGLIVLFGLGARTVAPGADFDGDGSDDVAIFRPATGLWAVKGVTRVYFGTGGDIPLPLDTDGNGTDEMAIFRPAAGLWAARGVTRTYFGSEGDVPLGKGGYNPYTSRYDYTVRPGDGADLERALESDTYDSVFVPAGDYTVSAPIAVDHLTRITGESTEKTKIFFSGIAYLSIASPGCTVEKLSANNGGFINIGAFFIASPNVTVRDCRSSYSNYDGFLYTSSAGFVSLINCIALYATEAGFRGSSSVRNSSLVNCRAVDTGSVGGADWGFYNCNNLSNCYVAGEYNGFYGCNNITSSMAYNCAQAGFWQCGRISACQVDGNGVSVYGFYVCANGSGCHVENCTFDEYHACTHFSTHTDGSCD